MLAYSWEEGFFNAMFVWRLVLLLAPHFARLGPTRSPSIELSEFSHRIPSREARGNPENFHICQSMKIKWLHVANRS